MNIVRENDLLLVSGKLEAGTFRIPGGISSQFVSGLMFALPLLEGDSEIVIEGRLESVDYALMTLGALRDAGVEVDFPEVKADASAGRAGLAFPDHEGAALSESITPFERRVKIKGGQKYKVSGCRTPEGDWSNAAFFLCMGAASRKGITVSGLDAASDQGDRRILRILEGFGAETENRAEGILVRSGRMAPQTIDASDIPDLVPVVAALAAGIPGETVIKNAGRLRFKESDRIRSTVQMINALGGEAVETEDGMVVTGRETLPGGTLDSQNDHRIAMAGAMMSLYCSGDVHIDGHKCVDKSYPGFWDDFFGLEVTK